MKLHQFQASFLKHLIIMSTLMGLSACANIPISTMLALSSFGTTDVLALEPKHIRAKIRLDQPGQLNLQSIKLSLDLNRDKGLQHFEFPLELLSQNAVPEESGFFSSTPAGTEYVFRFGEQAVISYNSIKRDFNANEKYSADINIRASLTEASRQEMTNSINMSIWLKLRDNEEYLHLIDGFEITNTKR